MSTAGEKVFAPRHALRPWRAAEAVVIGGGHAGLEAAWALAKLGHTVIVVTFDATGIARMSCNPSIGGLAKGQLAREVDALGGLMGRLADRNGIHFRMLNRKKGPAVHAPRAQVDRESYSRDACTLLASLPRVLIIEGEVTEIVTETAPGKEPRVIGVRLDVPKGVTREHDVAQSGDADLIPAGVTGPCRIVRIQGPCEVATTVVVLTVGTFLKGVLFTGMEPCPGGRRGEPPASSLSASLDRLGLVLGRLKTGTPPRISRNSIEFNGLEVQSGDEPPQRFSFFETCDVRNQVVCHLTRTSENTHQVIRASLERSPLFAGLIRGVGPRYCPSIEDKVVRFPERASHQVFLEPEGLESPLVYPNGLSTSLPADVQQAFLRTVPGLEHAEIVHPGYAVEYDFMLTSQLDSSMRVRGIEGLFAAGQINGTSGYEEAAAQGIIAGVNASASLTGRTPLILRRCDAYIGVLIDDLVTKTPMEPYRMFTSQSEYRLMLRQDDADRRLSRLGAQLGLLSPEDSRRVKERWARIECTKAQLRQVRVDGKLLGRLREQAACRGKDVLGETQDEQGLGKGLDEIIRRPGMTLRRLRSAGVPLSLADEDAISLEADLKYGGYVERLLKEIETRENLEDLRIPDSVLDHPPEAVSREARERLQERRPRTLGQASRIAGIGPCDISILAVRIHATAASRKAHLPGHNPRNSKGIDCE